MHRSVVNDQSRVYQLVSALLDYQSDAGHLPNESDSTDSSSGSREISWRALLLSKLIGKSVKYNPGVAWDSLENEHAKRQAEAFYCGNANASSGKCNSRIVAFSGPETAFLRRSSTRLEELPAELILFVSGSGLAIAPLERKDLDYRDLVDSEHTISEVLQTDAPVIVVFADLSVRLVSSGAPASCLGKLASTDGSDFKDSLRQLENWQLKELKPSAR